MTSHQSVDTVKSLHEIQYELLYASASFQVRLWHLQSGQKIPHFPQDNTQNGRTQESQCILISGSIAVSGTKGELNPQRGVRFVLNGVEDSTLTANSPSLLMELRWGQGLSEKPLQEITEERPWGSFTVLKDEPDYKMKQLSVKPGNRLSLQRHFKREEHWLVTAGTPEVTLDSAIHHLQAGDYIHIPLQSWHRISNPESAMELVEIIELQLGDYFGEDDIERSQDDYGRQ